MDSLRNAQLPDVAMARVDHEDVAYGAATAKMVERYAAHRLLEFLKVESAVQDLQFDERTVGQAFTSHRTWTVAPGSAGPDPVRVEDFHVACGCAGYPWRQVVCVPDGSDRRWHSRPCRPAAISPAQNKVELANM